MLEERDKPTVVSIMGQTGVGKSTLLNALFNTTLATGRTWPTTQEVKTQKITNGNGHTLIIHDMPGIGESEQIDAVRLVEYRQYWLESDVALWTLHADMRSVAFDVQALKILLEGMQPEQQKQLMSKITFVLTKVDLLFDAPWVMGYRDKSVKFVPPPRTLEWLDEKAHYYQDKLVTPYGTHIVSQTFNDVNFTLHLPDPEFDYDEYNVYYKGLLTKERVDELAQQHHDYAEVFKRLYHSYRVIPCSARFKYNLTELVIALSNKLELSAHERFKQAIDVDTLDQMSSEDAIKLCNIRIRSLPNPHWVLDLAEGTFPDMKRGDLRGWYRTAKKSFSLWPTQFMRRG